jgi:hypothetical protein
LILQNIQKKTRLLDMFKNKVKLEELIWKNSLYRKITIIDWSLLIR